MSFLYSWWNRGKKPAKPDKPLLAQPAAAVQLEETKEPARPAPESSAPPIQPNTLWDLLSDFSALYNSPALVKAPACIDDFSVASIVLKDRLEPKPDSAVAAKSVIVTSSENAKEAEKVVPEPKPSAPADMFKSEIGPQHSILHSKTPVMLAFINQNISSYTCQMAALSYLHCGVEARIVSLLKSQAHNPSESAAVLARLGTFSDALKDSVRFLQGFVSDLNLALTAVLEAKARLARTHTRTKYSTIGASALGLAASVAFPYVAAGGLVLSLLSGGVLMRRGKNEFQALVCQEELLVFVLNILVEKKELLETAVQYFAELGDGLRKLQEKTEPAEKSALTAAALRMVPLQVVTLLLRKQRLR